MTGMTSIKIDDEMMDGIENFIADRDESPRGKMSLDDAVYVMIKDWLMSQGYISISDEPAFDVPAKVANRGSGNGQ